MLRGPVAWLDAERPAGRLPGPAGAPDARGLTRQIAACLALERIVSDPEEMVLAHEDAVSDFTPPRWSWPSMVGTAVPTYAPSMVGTAVPTTSRA